MQTNTAGALERELDFARLKFPSSRGMTLAFLEEVCEAADAIAHHPEDSNKWKKELIQVCCTAIRLIEEGDSLMEEQSVKMLLKHFADSEDFTRQLLGHLVGDHAAARSAVEVTETGQVLG